MRLFQATGAGASPHPGTRQRTRLLSKMDHCNVFIVFSKPSTILDDSGFIPKYRDPFLQFGMVPVDQIVLQLPECPLSNEMDPSAGNRAAK